MKRAASRSSRLPLESRYRRGSRGFVQESYSRRSFAAATGNFYLQALPHTFDYITHIASLPRQGGKRIYEPKPQGETAMPPFRGIKTPVEILHYEIVQEQASALGRLGRGLEAALAELQTFDAAHPWAASESEASEAERAARRALVSAAGEALWMFVVQREACGLRETRSLMRDYKVPVDVQKQMGIFPARRGGSL
jgi:hypothetical protein